MLPSLAAFTLLCCPSTPAQSVGVETAHALHIASVADAQSAFFVGTAVCLNDPTRRRFDCFRELLQDYHQAVRLANAQLRERLRVVRLLPPGPYAPMLDPAKLSTKITNRFLPWKPGRTLVYKARDGKEVETTRITVSDKTTMVGDYECVTVRDVVSVDGEVHEDTIDWYAQDQAGNVWYLGEIAKNYEDGLLDNLDGSWRIGKDGAKPGILMLAQPKVGVTYREEFLPNEAEDLATVVSLNETVTVPAGTFRGCVQTRNFTPIEPGVEERKFYAPGIGVVLTVGPTGKRTELVQVIDP
ncbi:MAG: hypothetical protein H6836_06430 [Planctomycetes bacterium]|nr:hypothetical protein [Planctomycetota bacterium]MCB9889196.1 hypothetical protein [Planctomycetota bacterium]